MKFKSATKLTLRYTLLKTAEWKICKSAMGEHEGGIPDQGKIS